MTTQTLRTGTTVLVVEDDVLVRTCVADALEEHGFRVLQASNGPAAVRLLERSAADVVFTDINMPGEFDGLGLARRVRDRWPHIAIVITSGRACPKLDPAFATFVAKPYMPDAIPRIIDEAMCRTGEPRAAPKPACLAG